TRHIAALSARRQWHKAFGFAVGLRGVRLNPDVLDSELFASAREGFGEVAATIVSHDAFNGNAEAPEVGDGGEQERDGAFLLLVGEDLSTRYPGMVVDSDVDEFPARTLTAAIACAASGDAVAHAAETAELLNVEMDDLTWFLALVAWMWLLQLEAREPAEAAAFENARDAGFGDADLGCDVLLSAALTAQVFDGVGCGKRIWVGDERGLEDRSRKPSTPSAQKRSTHLPTVFGVVLNWRAAAALDMLRSAMARTISSRPFGVRRAFLWVSIRSSANR